MNRTLFERIFTEAEKPTFMGSVHAFAKAADISDPEHPWHKIFTKIGDLGRALKGGKSQSKARSTGPVSSLSAVGHHAPSRGPSAHQTLRALKRDVQTVGRTRARAAKTGATLRAMGRKQPGTGSRRDGPRRRSKVPGMEPPIR